MSPKIFRQYSEKKFLCCGKNLNCYKIGMLKKVISLWSWLIPWGTLWWISFGIVICKWEFDFLTYLWLFLAFWSVFQHFIITSIRAVHCSSAGLLLSNYNFLHTSLAFISFKKRYIIYLFESKNLFFLLLNIFAIRKSNQHMD